MQKMIIESIGWYGALAIVLAYGLLSFEVITATSIPYQLLNLTGAGAMIYHSLQRRDYQPAVLNGVWAVIALIAFIRIIV
jgi:ABC-type dipeptide/oligopeptide/nickel transport system permease component